MIIGDFELDLNIYISNNNGHNNASKQSSHDLNTFGKPIRILTDLGKMYTFKYYTPDEPEYDRNPIILSLGVNEYKNLSGINLHYIPFNIRVSFIKNIIKTYNYIITNEMQKINDPLNQKSLNDFTWQNLVRGYGKFFNLGYSIRQYRFDRIKDPLIIGYENWYIGVSNDENNFYGTNINKVQKLFYTNI